MDGLIYITPRASPTGYGLACFKHQVLAVITKANWSTNKLELFIKSTKYKNWQHPITPHAYKAYKNAQKYVSETGDR